MITDEIEAWNYVADDLHSVPELGKGLCARIAAYSDCALLSATVYKTLKRTLHIYLRESHTKPGLFAFDTVEERLEFCKETVRRLTSNNLLKEELLLWQRVEEGLYHDDKCLRHHYLCPSIENEADRTDLPKELRRSLKIQAHNRLLNWVKKNKPKHYLNRNGWIKIEPSFAVNTDDGRSYLPTHEANAIRLTAIRFMISSIQEKLKQQGIK